MLKNKPMLCQENLNFTAPGMVSIRQDYRIDD